MDEVEDLAGDGVVGSLFSRSAPENAEVVPPGDSRGPDSMWTVAANEPTPSSSTAGAASQATGGVRIPPFPPPPFGRPYRSPMRGTADTPASATTTVDDLWTERPERTGDMGDPPRWGEGTYGREFDPDVDGSIVDEDDMEPPDDGFIGEEDVFATIDEDTDEPGAHWHRGHDPGDRDGPRYRDGPHDRDGLRDSVGSLFRSEPVERTDLLRGSDEPEDDPLLDLSGRTLFSSGVRSSFGSGPTVDTGPGDPAGGDIRRRQSAWTARPSHAPTGGGASGGSVADAGAGGAAAGAASAEAESPGFMDAIESLAGSDRVRASVPLLVAGALLESDEQVLGLLVGQMLGRPAVMVLSARRIMVINDRHWQPVVDQYALDDDLEIRGRHDRNVAAIGLGDGRTLSMIDGIYDVDAAMDVVAAVRSLIGDD